MIADVLAEAVFDIRRYQSEYPHYEECKERIEKVVKEMEELRIWFDTPPPDEAPAPPRPVI